MNETKPPRFYRFGSIEQFKSTVKAVRDHSNFHATPLPTLTFTGSVKLHGTNAAIVYHARNGAITCQSRERIITPESDNAGFAQFADEHKDELREWLTPLSFTFLGDAIAVFGEWAGPKVQPGVAVSDLSKKQFFVFDIRVLTGDDSVKLTPAQIKQIVADAALPDVHSIYQFPTWSVAVDFNQPEAVQNRLVELTMAVEAECPVAKTFGISGIGEGIVWRCDDNQGIQGLTFKVKGAKHSTSKVRVLNEIAAVDVARLESVNQFLDQVVSANRLSQGLAKLEELGLPLDATSTGAYIKWVAGDVKAEEALTIEASGFAIGEILYRTSQRAKAHYLTVLTSA
jgi:hypothetical protein